MYEISIHKTDVGGGIPCVRNAKDIAGLFLADVPQDTCQEHLLVYFLDGKNRVTGKYTAAVGGSGSVVIDPLTIACAAVGSLARYVVICHNHPFGDPRPSSADIRETERLRKALSTLGISFVDHVIVGGNAYFSFADEVCRSLSDDRRTKTRQSNVNITQP